MGMEELSVVVNLSREVCVVFFGGFEYYLLKLRNALIHRIIFAYLRAVREIVPCQINLAKRALSDQTIERVIAYMA